MTLVGSYRRPCSHLRSRGSRRSVLLLFRRVSNAENAGVATPEFFLDSITKSLHGRDHRPCPFPELLTSRTEVTHPAFGAMEMLGNQGLSRAAYYRV